MSRILDTSDIHIHDYPNHNLNGDSKFRLNQFIGLAYRLVEIAKEHKCDYLFLGGDIVHRPLVPPHIAHVVAEFFRILHTQFDKEHLIYILGQHDLATKNQEQNLEDSLIHVITPYATYVDQTIMELDGKRIGFRNWTPDSDFSFIDEPVDLLLGHLTLSDMFGQPHDESKFHLGIFGDIHNKSSFGKSHTTNVPIPHYISDDQEGSVIIIDVPTMTWERVITESESFKHLKMYYDDVVSETDNPYIVRVKRPTTTVSTEHIHRSINLDEVIKGVVELANKQDIHNELSTFVDRSNTEATNLNFKINSIKISNFRSIKEFSYTPDTGITSVTGPNGAGKSSFMRAMDFVFRPPRSATHLVNKASNDMSVVIDIDYNGRNHIIDRGLNDGSGYLSYFVNEVPVASGSLSERNAVLNTNLPFIKYFDIIYRSQGAPSLLSDYGYAERIDLVNNLLGLALIDRYFKVADAKVRSLKSDIKNIETEITKQEGIVEANNDDFTILNDKVALVEQSEHIKLMITNLNSVKSTFSKIESLNIQVENSNSLLAAYKYNEELTNSSVEELANEVSKLTETGEILIKIENLNKSIFSFTSLRDAQTYDSNLAGTSIESIQNTISQGETLVNGFKVDIENIVNNRSEEQNKIINTKSEIAKLIESKTKVNTTCPSCKRALDTSDYEAVLTHIDDEISKLNLVLDKLNNEVKINDWSALLQSTRESLFSAEQMLSEFKINLVSINNEIEKKSRYDHNNKFVELYEKQLEESKVLVNTNDTVESINSKILILNQSINSINQELQKKTKYLEIESQMREYQVELVEAENNLPAETTLDMVNKAIEYNTELSNKLRDDLTRLSVLSEKHVKYVTSVETLEKLKVESSVLNDSLSQYLEYAQLFEPKGSVIKSVYLQVAALLSDNDITVRTVKELASGDVRVDFDIDLRVNGWNIPYSELSGGQKTRVDIYFLTKLFKMSGTVGMLILDETLKDLDSDNLELVAKMLVDAPINSVLLSTHVESFNFYDKRIHTSVVDGYSHYTIEGSA